MQRTKLNRKKQTSAKSSQYIEQYVRSKLTPRSNSWFSSVGDRRKSVCESTEFHPSSSGVHAVWSSWSWWIDQPGESEAVVWSVRNCPQSCCVPSVFTVEDLRVKWRVLVNWPTLWIGGSHLERQKLSSVVLWKFVGSLQTEAVEVCSSWGREAVDVLKICEWQVLNLQF